MPQWDEKCGAPFFLCLHSKRKWEALAQEPRATSVDGILEGPSSWNIIQWVTVCVRRKAIPLFIFVEMISMLWDKRNLAHFQGKRSCTPICVILQNAAFSGRAYMEEITSQKKLARFKIGLEELTEVTNRFYSTRK